MQVFFAEKMMGIQCSEGTPEQNCWKTVSLEERRKIWYKGLQGSGRKKVIAKLSLQFKRYTINEGFSIVFKLSKKIPIVQECDATAVL